MSASCGCKHSDEVSCRVLLAVLDICISQTERRNWFNPLAWLIQHLMFARFACNMFYYLQERAGVTAMSMVNLPQMEAGTDKPAHSAAASLYSTLSTTNGVEASYETHTVGEGDKQETVSQPGSAADPDLRVAGPKKGGSGLKKATLQATQVYMHVRLSVIQAWRYWGGLDDTHSLSRSIGKVCYSQALCR